MKSSMFKVLAILICVTALTASPVFAGKPCNDAAPPTVDAFDIPATSETLTVSITTFTASDDCKVDGYMVTESATAPAANDPNWSNSAPASYNVESEGIYTLYAWALDGAGNVSSSMSDTVTVAFPAVDADTLDGLDSTDFTYYGELYLPQNYSEPYTCGPADAGAIVLTGRFTTCVCNGDKWVLTADGTTDCRWNVRTVISAGKEWMDRNLGASQVATSSTDSAAYGDMYQWGRGPDGHQLRYSATTTATSPSDDPEHDDFIINHDDWRNPQNDNLWQGVSGTNNPCPAGFRLPTGPELDTERASWSSQNKAGAYASPLKLTVAGQRDRISGNIWDTGTRGTYWSSTTSGPYAWQININNDSIGTDYNYRGYGMSVRCILD